MKKTFLLFVLCLFYLPQVLTADGIPPSTKDEPGFWDSFRNFFLPHVERRTILFEKDTKYFNVTVEEDSNGFRHLVFNPNKGSQGIWNPSSPADLCSKYCKYSSMYLAASVRPPKRILFIGLGAGIMPRFMREQFPSSIIDIAEIDPGIEDIAEKYFRFKSDPEMKVTVGDGRVFVNITNQKYDAVFIDAYTADSIPFQLTTVEFFKNVRKVLVPDGLMIANIANLGRENFIASELKTILKVFPESKVFITENSSNYIVFSTPEGEIDIDAMNDKASSIDSGNGLNFKMLPMIDNLMSDDELQEFVSDGTILTDDFAPVETMK